MEFTRYIDNVIYSRKALADAREAYNQYCTIRATPGAGGEIAVTVLLKGEFKDHEARQVILEFWNFFLDSSCKHKLESA